MEKYNYKEEMIEDIIFYIKDNNVLNYEYSNIDELHTILNDELWDCDDVTGNGGSYYASAAKCEEYLVGNLRLALEAFSDFGFDYKKLSLSDDELIQYIDSTVRRYLLWDCIWEALERLGVKSE